jgi:RNase adaptor protein for sRNA GlmZ degradation
MAPIVTTNPPPVTIRLINSGWKACKVQKNKLVGPAKDANILALPPADLYLDCRVIPNPYLVTELGEFTREDTKVMEWVKEHGAPYLDSFYQLIIDGLQQIPSRRLGKADPFERPYTVCTMCAHGIHRSRAMKYLLATQLVKDGWNVTVE